MALGLACSAAGAVNAGDGGRFSILQLDGHRVSWHRVAGDNPVPVTYRVITEPIQTPGARNCRRMVPPDALLATSKLDAATLQTEIAAAFAMWEAAADITFREVTGSAKADILIGSQADPEGWAYTDVVYDTKAPDAVKPISSARICLNPAKRWKVGFDGNLKVFDLRYTLAHEIGHAIGLDHPEAPHEIMGYGYEEAFRVLQPGDIEGATRIYGPARQKTETVTAQGPQPREPQARRFAKRWGTRAFRARSP